LLLALGLTGLLSSCGGGAGGLQSESASQVVRTALAAARSAGTFQFVDREGSGSQARLLSGDTGTVAAQQTSTGDGERLEVSLVGGVALAQTGSLTLENYFGLSTTQATQDSGKWVSVTKGEKDYDQIVQSLTPDAELGALHPAD
jgi:hypothetical protein